MSSTRGISCRSGTVQPAEVNTDQCCHLFWRRPWAYNGWMIPTYPETEATSRPESLYSARLGRESLVLMACSSTFTLPGVTLRASTISPSSLSSSFFCCECSSGVATVEVDSSSLLSTSSTSATFRALTSGVILGFHHVHMYRLSLLSALWNGSNV